MILKKDEEGSLDLKILVGVKQYLEPSKLSPMVLKLIFMTSVNNRGTLWKKDIPYPCQLFLTVVLRSSALHCELLNFLVTALYSHCLQQRCLWTFNYSFFLLYFEVGGHMTLQF